MKGRLEQVSTQNVKQIQRLILSPQMQQALHLLQLPVMELETAIEEELTLNPLLEYSEDENSLPEEEFEILSVLDQEMRASTSQTSREEEDLKSFIENTVAYESSLYEHLMEQARETFVSQQDLDLAQVLIGNLDHDGILTTSLEEIAALFGTQVNALIPILDSIKTFDPIGVGAQDLKEALLIQLKGQGKEKTLAFRIIEQHYQDVIHNRIPLIAKNLNRTPQDIRLTIAQEISHLDLHPGTNQSEGHYRQMTQHLTPDLMISYSNGKFEIDINSERIPNLRLNKSYLQMLSDATTSNETRDYIREKISSGKWLLRNLHERHQTLYRIAEQLIKYQNLFFSSPKGQLVPLTMKEIAEELELHESTIARAVSNKYLTCARGILPLRSFFTHSYTTNTGKNISSHTVKDLLCEMLDKEDKARPLSDEVISAMIKEKGIPCARRTIAKYRQELNIGNTTQRKIH